MKQRTPQSFNRGLAEIRRSYNAAAPGEMPRERREKLCAVRYHQRTVGMGRYWTALQAGTRITKVIRCPLIPAVREKDVVILESGEAYGIRQIQYPEDVVPPVMDLSLERIELK